MKNKLFFLLLLAAGSTYQASAQVQANKQLQMTGATEDDRRITGVGTAADSLDAVNAISLQSNRLGYALAFSKGNIYEVQLKVAPAAYTAGMLVSFKVPNANIGADSLNINGLGAKPLFKNVSELLGANEVMANQVVSVIYDGTAFQVISQLRASNGFTGSLSGDVSGTQKATLITDGAISTNKISDGAVTDAKIAAGISYSKIVGAPTALPPSGLAGGDLNGSYPNPAISNHAITTVKIADGAVTTNKLNNAGASAGQALVFDGTQVLWATPNAKPIGIAGGDLTGSFPNPDVANNAITTPKISDNAITNTKLADGSVTTLKIEDGAVISLKLADGSVLTAKVADAAITTAKIADNAITTEKIKDNAITGSKIETNAVQTTHINDGAVTDEKINSVAYSKITGAPTSLPPTGAASGDLAGSFPNPSIASSAVTTSKIADAAVTDDKIASGISYSKIVGAPTALPPSGTAGGDLNGSYPNPAINNGAVTAAKIASGVIDDSHISATASIDYSKLNLSNRIASNDLMDGAVTDAKINSVSYSKITGAPTALPPTGTAGGDLSGTYPNPSIAADAISTSKIADGAVTTNKINPTGANNGEVMVYNGTTVTWAVPNAKPIGTAGGDLTGTYPDPSIAAAAVTASKIANGAVTNAHVDPAAAIAYSKLNLTNSIVGPDIKSDAISTSKIANGAVTTAKISTAGATTGQALTYNGSSVVWGTVSAVPTGTASGDLNGTYPNPTIANGTVTSSKIADGTITDADVNTNAAIVYSKLNLTNSIVAADITNSAITSGKIKDGAVSTSKIADDAVTDAKIADGISYSKLIGVPTSMAPSGSAGGDLSGNYPSPTLATNAVTTVKIADDAVTTNKLMDAAITTSKINDGAVTTSKINTAGAVAGQVLTYDGTTVTWANTSGSGGASLQFHGTITSSTSYNSGDVIKYNTMHTNASNQMSAAGVFTAAATALYQINASLPSSAGDVRFLALRVNGTDVFTGSGAASVTAPSPYNATLTALSLSVAYPLTANDQVELILYNNAGAATPLTNGAARLLITRLN